MGVQSCPLPISPVRPRTDKDGAGRASAGRVHADQAETPVAKKVVALPIQAKTGNGKESPRLAAVATKTRKKVRLPVSRRKLFVLDTNVLLHDSNSLFKFEEHDIFQIGRAHV